MRWYPRSDLFSLLSILNFFSFFARKCKGKGRDSFLEVYMYSSYE